MWLLRYSWKFLICTNYLYFGSEAHSIYYEDTGLSTRKIVTFDGLLINRENGTDATENSQDNSNTDHSIRLLKKSLQQHPYLKLLSFYIMSQHFSDNCSVESRYDANPTSLKASK